MDEHTIVRFRAKLGDQQPDGCRPWNGARDPSGYGLFAVKGRPYRAHRIAWEIAHGPIPVGLIVRHNCDNPPCCQTDPTDGYPEGHLSIGTIADNNHDAKERRRHFQGGRHAVAKLTDEDVLRARQMRRDGMAWKAIAAAVGVSYTAVHYAVNGETWRHLPKPIDLPKISVRDRIAPEAIEAARRMRDEERATWSEIETATGYTRQYLQEHLPLRTGYNPNPVILAPAEADEAVRLRQDGMSWTKLSRHFENRISRMGLYYAWRNRMAWWVEAEARAGPVESRVAVASEPREKRMDRPYRRGTEHHNAKLTEEKVWLIRAKRLSGLSWAQIAEDLHLHRTTVSAAGKGQTWQTAGAPVALPAMVKGRRGRT